MENIKKNETNRLKMMNIKLKMKEAGKNNRASLNVYSVKTAWKLFGNVNEKINNYQAVVALSAV
jgi:hypothetical protein